jgi:hypothetical protein
VCASFIAGIILITAVNTQKRISPLASPTHETGFHVIDKSSRIGFRKITNIYEEIRNISNILGTLKFIRVAARSPG